MDLLENTFSKANLVNLLKLSALTSELLERVANIERVSLENRYGVKFTMFSMFWFSYTFVKDISDMSDY